MSTVGVNLLWLVPGVVGGSEEYTLRLLRAFDQFGGDEPRLRLYGQRALFEAHPDLGERFETVVSPRADFAAVSKVARIGNEHSWLAMASRHDDLVHHAGGVVPAIRSTPTVLTIHDLQPLEMPQHFSAARRRWLAATVPPSVRSARLVLAPSQYTLDRVHALLGAPRSKLEVVPHGQRSLVPGVLDADTDRRLRARYGRFALLPAISYPHKRHLDLVAATVRLADRFAGLSVVITGRPGPLTAAITAEAVRAGLSSRVHQLGRVPERELDALYRSATFTVFPSEYEGFGNPVMEAMARGCPVISSDATALPEVVGSAGLIVPVRRPDALAGAMARILDEPVLAEQLRAAGVVRAKQFSWEVAGGRLGECYRQALRLAG